MQGESPVIEAVDVTLFFNKCTAVDHVSFQVHQGEIFGLLGEDGAGKSTLLKLLAGLLAPSTGVVRLFGTNIWEAAGDFKETISIVPQNANPFLEMSGWQNVMVLGEMNDGATTGLESQVRTLLLQFKLWEWRHMSARIYSDSMRRRLMIAMALVNEPRILFLDDPGLGLDANDRHMIHTAVRDLSQR